MLFVFLPLTLFCSVIACGSSCQKEELHDYIFDVAYDGNGHDSGSDSAGFGDFWSNSSTLTVTVRGQGDLFKAGYDFLGWSTDQLSATAQYIEGDIIILDWEANRRIKLYAVWVADP